MDRSGASATHDNDQRRTVCIVLRVVLDRELAVLTEQGVEGRGVKVATVLFGEREQAAEAVRLLAVVVSVVEVEAAIIGVSDRLGKTVSREKRLTRCESASCLPRSANGRPSRIDD